MIWTEKQRNASLVEHQRAATITNVTLLLAKRGRSDDQSSEEWKLCTP
jgi:hypothetical protein